MNGLRSCPKDTSKGLTWPFVSKDRFLNVDALINEEPCEDDETMSFVPHSIQCSSILIGDVSLTSTLIVIGGVTAIARSEVMKTSLSWP